ncbi:hypothetical protein V6N12_051347 [Hibiscus sabdariffa]|uniref:Transmembrane protein n=1 Tax=Hibiscus sabdariffa TaxID=183260 RepID=A0ABR2GG43_9ROSI
MMRPGRRSVSILPVGNREEKDQRVSRFRMFPLAHKWVHAIPFIIFLCFFILWFLSRPVNVEMKDGGIVVVQPLTNSQSSGVAVVLSNTSLPVASAPPNLTLNGTQAIRRIIASY